jgi:hypothetical protein
MKRPPDASGHFARPRSVRRDASKTHIWTRFPSRRTVRSLCVARWRWYQHFWLRCKRSFNVRLRRAAEDALTTTMGFSCMHTYRLLLLCSKVHVLGRHQNRGFCSSTACAHLGRHCNARAIPTARRQEVADDYPVRKSEHARTRSFTVPRNATDVSAV